MDCVPRDFKQLIHLPARLVPEAERLSVSELR